MSCYLSIDLSLDIYSFNLPGRMFNKLTHTKLKVKIPIGHSQDDTTP